MQEKILQKVIFAKRVMAAGDKTKMCVDIWCYKG